MKEKVTIVPVDTIVIVNNIALNLEELSGISITDTIHSSSIHAIQWANGQGHVEFVDSATPNKSLSGEADYAVWVAPFATLWEAEKTRLEEIADTPPTLEEAQQSQLETINSAYESTVAVAKVNTPDGEVLTWDIQKIEAEDWAADNSAETPFIDGIATGRGMDRVVLIEKVLAKAEAYRDLVSVQTGIRQGLEDAIFAAETVDAARAIVWPVDDADDGADVDGAADASAD